MADATLFPRGRKPVVVSIGDENNPVVAIKVINNTTSYTLADGTLLVAGTVVADTVAAGGGSSVDVDALTAKMITYAIIMGED